MNTEAGTAIRTALMRSNEAENCWGGSRCGFGRGLGMGSRG